MKGSKPFHQTTPTIIDMNAWPNVQGDDTLVRILPRTKKKAAGPDVVANDILKHSEKLITYLFRTIKKF